MFYEPYLKKSNFSHLTSCFRNFKIRTTTQHVNIFLNKNKIYYKSLKHLLEFKSLSKF